MKSAASPLMLVVTGPVVDARQAYTLRARVEVNIHVRRCAVQGEHTVLELRQRGLAVRRQGQGAIERCLQRGQGRGMQRGVYGASHFRP